MNKTGITNVSPTFQALTKSIGKTLDLVYAPRALHRRDICISPLLPATWAIIYSLKANVNNKFFSSDKFNVLKKARCLASFSIH